MKTPILGSSYVARSVNAADSRMVNLFPEVVLEGGKEPAFLQRCAGLRSVVTVGQGPIRGLWKFGDYLYVASGGELYRADGNFSDLQPGDLRLAYWWQVQQQLRVTGCASGWLAVWTVYEFHLIYIEADAEAAATIDKAIAAAWKWVAHPKGLLPAPTDADSLAAIAASIKPKSEEPKQVDGDLADDIARYVAIGKQVDELEAEQSAIKRRLLIAHADAAALVTADGFKSSFVAATSRRSVDTKRLQAERPDVAEEFTRTTEVSAGCRVTAPRAKKV